jgi:hypothetical protein
MAAKKHQRTIEHSILLVSGALQSVLEDGAPKCERTEQLGPTATTYTPIRPPMKLFGLQ